MGRGEPMDEKGWLGERHLVYLAVKFYSNPRGHGSRGPFPFSIPTGKTRRDETRMGRDGTGREPSHISPPNCRHVFPEIRRHLPSFHPPFVPLRPLRFLFPLFRVTSSTVCIYMCVCVHAFPSRSVPGGGGLSSIYRKHDLYIDVAGYA